MKILIVDDEAPAREMSRSLLQKYFPETSVCAEATSVEQAYQAVKSNLDDIRPLRKLQSIQTLAYRLKE